MINTTPFPHSDSSSRPPYPHSDSTSQPPKGLLIHGNKEYAARDNGVKVTLRETETLQSTFGESMDMECHKEECFTLSNPAVISSDLPTLINLESAFAERMNKASILKLLRYSDPLTPENEFSS